MGYTGDKGTRRYFWPYFYHVAGTLGSFADGDTDTGKARVHIRELGLTASLDPAHRLHSSSAEPVKFPRRLPARGHWER